MDFLFQPEPVAWVQRFIGLGHPEPFRIIGELGTSWGILLAVALALWLFGRRTLYVLLTLVVAEAVVKKVLSTSFGIQRPSAPSIVYYEEVPSAAAFPSGHVATATALWTFLGGTTAFPILAGVLIALSVAVSRLYLGIHYVADVLGGLVLGGLLAWLWSRVGRRLVARLGSWGFGVWLGIAGVMLAVAVGSIFFYVEESRFRWNAAALTAGIALALPLEWRYVRYRPPEGAGARLRVLLVGGVGVLLPMAAELSSREESLAFGAGLILLATVWALLLAPALLAHLGWSGEGEAERPRAVRRTAHAALVVLTVIGGLATYGVAIEPRFLLDAREERAALPDLPPELDGVRVAVLADLQVGMWWDNRNMIRRMVRQILSDRPDLVLVAGDFIYHPGTDASDEVRAVLEDLRPLTESEIPVLAVLGNHDWGIDHPDTAPDTAAARAVEGGLEDGGIQVLRNEARAVTVGASSSSTLWVAGIGSHWAGEDRPAEAVESIPAGQPRIVLMHHPDSFEGLPAGAAPLAVSGHTHGGQVRLPLLPHWSWLSFTAQDEAYADGWIEEEYGAPGNRLYVNRGTGFSAIPLRIRARPELTYMTLRREEGPAGGAAR